MPVKRKNAPKKGKDCTIMEIEGIFGVTALTVRRWIDSGLPAQKTGKVWRINTAEMFAFVRAMDAGKQVDPTHDLDARLATAKVTRAEIEAADAAARGVELIRIATPERALALLCEMARLRDERGEYARRKLAEIREAGRATGPHAAR